MREDSPIRRGVVAANHITTGHAARREAINAATDVIVEMAVSTHALDIVARMAAEHIVAQQLLTLAETPAPREAAAGAVQDSREKLTDALWTLGYLAPAPVLENQENTSGNAA